MQIIRQDQVDFDARVLELRDRLRAGELVASTEAKKLDVPAVVSDILHQVRTRGDDAVLELEARLDQARLTAATLRVSAEDIGKAHAAADASFLALVRRVIANIRQYQQSILHKDPPPLTRGGRTLGVRYLPVDRVGVYVPGGRALYPSSVLMTVVPAQVAGVREIVLASPPRGGDIDPMVLALAGELGVTEVLRIGGAVAIGAMAYGTATIKPVDKIVGPGNAFVAQAKRQVLGQVGIDSIAGPSEVLLVADDTARADYVAADMIAQAEHDPGSAILVTTSPRLVAEVPAQLTAQLARLERGAATASCLERYSAILLVDTLERACQMANLFATEHLQIAVADTPAALAMIRHAGAIFIGQHSPVPLGDYYAGPSHVLPTGGTARFFSPLSCNDFLKSTSLIQYDAASLAADGADVIDFATREGLTGHAAAVRVRNP